MPAARCSTWHKRLLCLSASALIGVIRWDEFYMPTFGDQTTRGRLVEQQPLDRLCRYLGQEFGNPLYHSRQGNLVQHASVLFRIGRIVEQHRQLDAAVAKLREVRFRRIGGIEVR